MMLMVDLVLYGYVGNLYAVYELVCLVLPVAHVFVVERTVCDDLAPYHRDAPRIRELSYRQQASYGVR